MTNKFKFKLLSEKDKHKIVITILATSIIEAKKKLAVDCIQRYQHFKHYKIKSVRKV